MVQWWLPLCICLAGITCSCLWYLIVHIDFDDTMVPIFLIFAIIGSTIGAVMVYLAAHQRPEIQCKGARNQLVQWARENDDKSHTKWVYVTIKGDRDHFCMVQDDDLYKMGIGYMLAHDYSGILVRRP